MDNGHYGAVVTGGASGIGRAIAEELAARGIAVVLADVDLERAEAAAREIGGRACAAHCDVTDPASVDALVAVSERLVGPVGLVFANAGVSAGGPLLQSRTEEFDFVFAVNVRGTWCTLAAFARRMIEQGIEGRLCVTGSEHSIGMQHAGLGFYTASKHAVLGLADVLRAELPPAISISVLCPGIVATDLNRSKRNSSLPPDDAQTLAFGDLVMSMGKPAAEIAMRAVDGVLAGEFLIPTHAHSIRPAEKRWGEIKDAWGRLAPWHEGAEAYEMDSLLARAVALAHQKGE